MNKDIKEIIKHEIQILLKEDKRSELISKLRREAIENDNIMWFVEKYDHNLPNDETRAAVIEFGEPSLIYWYALNIDKGGRDDTRNAVLDNPAWSFWYAMNIDKKERDDTRNAAWRNNGVGKVYDKRFGISTHLLKDPFDDY